MIVGENRIPITRNRASDEREAAIRSAVRGAKSLPTGDGESRLAVPGDADALFAFLSDPAVHAPIRSLPSPLSPASIRSFIEQHEAEREAGEGLLFVTLDEAGEVVGYSDVGVWPEWAAGRLGGALHPRRQGEGRGTRGADASFAWMFDVLGLDLICETAVPDNVRTGKLLAHLGFESRGEITAAGADGQQQPFLVWEMTRASWQARAQ